jgi:1-acyl-sn-glycerol-3-phosphate acyltransferase
MDFPFMKRYSREYLKRHPEKRGEDLETTRRFCRRFQKTSISIFNFLEGTRYRKEKHDAQDSPYRHLLRPKAGGIAFTLAAMGEKLDTLLNVTLAYPDGIPEFSDFLTGQVRRVVVEVESMPIPAHFAHGDYRGDPEFRTEFQTWVNDLWAEKDQKVDEILKRHGVTEHVLA